MIVRWRPADFFPSLCIISTSKYAMSCVKEKWEVKEGIGGKSHASQQGPIRIKGNEDADREAQGAADRDSLGNQDPPYLRKKLKYSTSATK
jgi:hypothetical protein